MSQRKLYIAPAPFQGYLFIMNGEQFIITNQAVSKAQFPDEFIENLEPSSFDVLIQSFIENASESVDSLITDTGVLTNITNEINDAIANFE